MELDIIDQPSDFLSILNNGNSSKYYLIIIF